MLKVPENLQTFCMFCTAFTRITRLTNLVLLVYLVTTMLLGLVCLFSVRMLVFFPSLMFQSLPGTVIPPLVSPSSLNAFCRS